MPVPSSMSDLSTTAASNSPAGSDSPTSGDDYLRSIQAIIRTTNAKGADIASAATTDIGAATGEFVDVTGTTTITGLGTVAAGIVRTVRFTGALTLTYNATSLILPGSANITTATGDVAQFRSLGSGNWLCVGYVKADGGALSVPNDSITYAKIQNVSATSRALGRKTAGAGDIEELTLSELLDFIGSAAQGDILYRDAAGWARLGAGTSGQFLKTQGAGANPTWASAITTQLVTDSTDIAMTAVLGTSQQNVGSSFSVNIPANGVIRLASLSGRFLNSATAAAHNYAFGIRIGTTNYWFLQGNNNGTLSTVASVCVVSTGSTSNAYYEYYGSAAGASSNQGNITVGGLDVASLSIPTGTQTVQLITAYVTNAGTIKGTSKQTRVLLEFIG